MDSVQKKHVFVDHPFAHRPRQAFLDWIDSLRPKVVVVKRPPEPLGVRAREGRERTVS